MEIDFFQPEAWIALIIGFAFGGGLQALERVISRAARASLNEVSLQLDGVPEPGLQPEPSLQPKPAAQVRCAQERRDNGSLADPRCAGGNCTYHCRVYCHGICIERAPAPATAAPSPAPIHPCDFCGALPRGKTP